MHTNIYTWPRMQGAHGSPWGRWGVRTHGSPGASLRFERESPSRASELTSLTLGERDSAQN